MFLSPLSMVPNDGFNSLKVWEICLQKKILDCCYKIPEHHAYTKHCILKQNAQRNTQ